jgi:hypothetical protein
VSSCGCMCRFVIRMFECPPGMPACTGPCVEPSAKNGGFMIVGNIDIADMSAQAIFQNVGKFKRGSADWKSRPN